MNGYIVDLILLAHLRLSAEEPRCFDTLDVVVVAVTGVVVAQALL